MHSHKPEARWAALWAAALALALPAWMGAQSLGDKAASAAAALTPNSVDEAPMMQTARNSRNPFDRPVEEEVTEELIRQTDLSQEGGSIISRIFDSEEQIQDLIGAEPSFIYDSGGRRDPMIIPWIRREYDVTQLMAAGRAAEMSGDLAEALENFRRVVEGYGGTRAADEAMVAIARIEALRSQESFSADPDAPVAEIVVLPLQIRTGLSGILYDEVRPTCCIGPFIFAEGDTVDPFNVTVLEIHQEEVVFLYRDRQFTVPVVPN